MSPDKPTNNPLSNLGELELRVMDLLWQESGLSAKDVHERLAVDSGLNTIQSTLERLRRKSLVARHKQGHAYLYRAAVRREELTARLINTVIERLQLGNLEPVLSSFVDFAEGVDESTLNRLERLIQERKQQRIRDND